ncbi:MAG: DUF885 domain-containing protein, partial [Gammaproteobacteria bacterium]|nr:DUF885 domain-containing protein [Gammaproteobacteria bacterium]
MQTRHSWTCAGTTCAVRKSSESPASTESMQMISLQYRLMRAARMFLGPMLNLGLIKPAEAKALIMDDVAVGEAWAQNEVERYTYRIPGQATA